jgi:aspartate 1-decarboxylase
LFELKPRILTFLPDNHVDQVLLYDVFSSEERPYDFRILDADKHTVDDCHTWPNVDITAIRADLEAKGWAATDIDAFIKSHFSL